MITTFTGSNSFLLQNELHKRLDTFMQEFGDFGLDAAAFYTNIDNRLAVFYENGIGEGGFVTHL